MLEGKLESVVERGGGGEGRPWVEGRCEIWRDREPAARRTRQVWGEEEAEGSAVGDLGESRRGPSWELRTVPGTEAKPDGGGPGFVRCLTPQGVPPPLSVGHVWQLT